MDRSPPAWHPERLCAAAASRSEVVWSGFFLLGLPLGGLAVLLRIPPRGLTWTLVGLAIVGALLALFSGVVRYGGRRDLADASYYIGVTCLQLAEVVFYMLVVVLLARFGLTP